MAKTSTFQIVLISIFSAFILTAIIVFATSHPGQKAALPPVTVWGTISYSDFTSMLASETNAQGEKFNVTYVQEQPATFSQDIINAIADGNGPDIVLLPQDLILQYQNKIYPLPYTSYPLRNYQESYVQEASLFTTPTGILAFPFTVDPLVMYWNRDILASAGIVSPPQNWSDFLTLPQLLGKQDGAGNIVQSAVALGEYSNITDAKDILSAMFLQAGNSIVARNANSELLSVLGNSAIGGTTNTGLVVANPETDQSAVSSSDTPADSVLRFYTQFSDPSKTTYSWNEALTDSQDMFAEGDLAVYFGFASEYNTIRAKNPNLNFDVTYLPQPDGAQTDATYGTMLGMAVLKSSKNIAGAYLNVYALTSSNVISAWSAKSGTPPALLSLLAVSHPSSPDEDIFYRSALISKGWLDPNPDQTDTIFGSMVDAVTSGSNSIGGAVDAASNQIQQSIQSI